MTRQQLAERVIEAARRVVAYEGRLAAGRLLREALTAYDSAVALDELVAEIQGNALKPASLQFGIVTHVADEDVAQLRS